MKTKKKLIILFDVDRTLIDTDQLKRKFFAALATLTNRSADQIKQSYLQYRESLKNEAGQISVTEFNPSVWLKIINQETGVSLKKLTTTFLDPELYLQSVFADTVPTLEKLQPKVILGIFSESVTSWQKKKIKQAGLAKFFDQNYQFIYLHKLLEADEDLTRLDSGSVIVDDRLDILLNLAKKYPHLRLIHINRKPTTKNKVHHQIKTIKSLTELTKLLGLS